MMDWTDRHCRFVHRQFSPHALLYTEMIVAAAIVRGNAQRLLDHDAAEHPVALQLGGCNPQELAAATRIGTAAGYAEINLNVGCPSDRVKNGSFGACLMLNPPLVADCVRAMRGATQLPVTVKCRIGIDDRDDYDFFLRFVDAVEAAGIDALIVHARAAILGGLSPKENREIPPLKYDYVHRLKRERPALTVVLNGGLSDVREIRAHIRAGARYEAGTHDDAGTYDDAGAYHDAGPHLGPGAHYDAGAHYDLGAHRDAGLDGVMLGRAAYHRPALLAELEQAVIDPAWRIPEAWEIIEKVVSYARRQARHGVRLHSITRHMHGLMAGRDGARAWRRFLSEVAARPEAVPETLFSALPLLNQGIAA